MIPYMIDWRHVRGTDDPDRTVILALSNLSWLYGVLHYLSAEGLHVAVLV